jgi:hypothetical protein
MTGSDEVIAAPGERLTRTVFIATMAQNKPKCCMA